ncbi:hypothetical protein WDU94_003579 [Cyamophila willieti]
MATQLFKLAKNNLFFLVNDLKPTYRNEEVTAENVHVINGAASDVSQALDKYDKALEDYVAALSEDSSVNSEDDENSVMSCRRFLRLLNAKLAKFAEHCEEKRADTIRVNEEKRADERARLELESRERIEMEKIRLAATAGTMADTATATTATTASTSNLPKINLQTFGGDVTRFQEFWDCFNAAVDCRLDLSNSVKLTYLKGVLNGQAASLILGIRVTDDNYEVAKQILIERYNIPELVTSKLLNELLNLKPLSSQPHDVHKFYSDIEIRLKLLENHNCNIEQAMLRDHLLKLVSRPMQNELLKEYGVSVTVRQIRELINKEVRLSLIKEAFQLNPVETSNVSKVNQGQRHNYQYYRGVSNKPCLPTTSALVSSNPTPSITYPCVFCDSDRHPNYDCTQYRSSDERRNRMLNRCYLCLSTSHFFGNCPVRNKTKCYYCKRVGHHNSAICPKQFGKVRNANHPMNSVRHTSTVSKELSDNKIVPSKSAVDSENTRSTEESCSISNSGEMTLCAKAGIQTRVYLQTATIKVFNPKTNEIQKVRAVLDSGATSSYISQQLFDSLGLKRDYTKQVNVYTFGQSSSKSMVVQGAKIAIEDKVGKRYNLEVSVVPTIVGNTKREVCEIEWIRELNKQYALADEYYEAGNDESFHLLLGNDYYSSIMLDDKKIKIQDNMYLVNTVFGILTGTVDVIRRLVGILCLYRAFLQVQYS